MSMKRNQATGTQVYFEAHVLGNNGMLLGMRKFRSSPPRAELMEMLLEFNYMKRDEFLSATIVVIKQTTIREEDCVFTKPLELIISRVDDRRKGISVRGRVEEP